MSENYRAKQAIQYENENRKGNTVHKVGQNLTEGFHIYEMIWRAESIEIYFDDALLHTYTANSNNNINNLFGKKHKVVLNTAVGGLFFSDQNPDNYADNSMMQIDWVKVYKK